MKKLLFVLSLVAVTSLTAFAQRPVAGAKGFTFGLQPIFTLGSTSLNNGPARTGSLLFRYYVADGLAARVAINYTKSSDKTVDTTSSTGHSIETKNSTSTFAIQVGAQKSLGEGEKLEPYIGADLLFSKTSGKYSEDDQTVKASGGTVGDYTMVEADGSSNGFGGYNAPSTNIGLIPMVGFNYFFTENIALGAEFGWGFIISSSNNRVEEVTTDKVGNTTTTTTVGFNDETSSTNFSTQGNHLVTFSIFF